MPTSDILRVLSETRGALSLSQAALARKLGLTQAQISLIERGLSDPRFSTLQNIAGALDLQLMLVPRQLGPVVATLIADSLATQDSASDADFEPPLYRLESQDHAALSSASDVVK